MQVHNEIGGGWCASNRDVFDAAIRSAVANALSNLKRLGLPAPTMRDNRVFLVPPDQIVVDEVALRKYNSLRKFSV